MVGVLTIKIIYVYRDGSPTNVCGRLIAVGVRDRRLSSSPPNQGLRTGNLYGIFLAFSSCIVQTRTHTYNIIMCFAYGKCGGKKNDNNNSIITRRRRKRPFDPN